MTKKIRTYSTEFKAEAVKKIADNSGNISATAKQLGIAMQTLSNWHNKANQGKLVGIEQYDPKLIAWLCLMPAYFLEHHQIINLSLLSQACVTY